MSLDNKIKEFHKVSDRHVLMLEANLSHVDKCELFGISEKLRKMGNELLSIMYKNYKQLIRTKRYRNFKKLYGITKEEIVKLDSKINKTDSDKAKLKDLRVKLKEISVFLNKMQKEYNVTWDYCRNSMITINNKYKINSIFALTKAEDIWHSIEKLLYGDGKRVHFSKRGELFCIRAKQIERGIILKEDNCKLLFKIGNISFKPILKDTFEKDEVYAIIDYLRNKELIELNALKEYEKGNIISTYRPCFISLTCKKIRDKLRVYIHITIEGKVKPKKNKKGEIKHKLGTGIIGCDIGPSTIAYVSNTKIGLKNLAERGKNIAENERKEKLILRKLDRSRRSMNPQNYNNDGTIKKNTKSFKKKWIKSKRYLKLERKHKELCRINAVNRHLAINEEVNLIRSLGNILVTEPKNAKKLQRKIKETKRQEKINIVKDSKGNEKQIHKYKKKKRFGKSIKNRCPGYFQEKIKQKFINTNGSYIEVPKDYRASQYDHTSDSYIKKKLSDRMFKLLNETIVQRDLYSAFLMYCIDLSDKTINKKNCDKEFNSFITKQNDLINYIKENNIKILNSGIKTI